MAKNYFFLPYKENITKASGNNWLYCYIISKEIEVEEEDGEEE
jgi:hypothetical protein